MANGRRGNAPDLRSALGSLLRSTLDQVDNVREVVEQQARSRGGLLDQALVQRRRKEALVQLGESVLRLVQQGELEELALHPEIGMALSELQSIDDELTDDEGGESELRSRGAEAVSSASYQAPSSSSREEYRVWRPTRPSQQAPRSGEDSDFDTVDDAAPAAEVGEAGSTSRRISRKPATRGTDGIRFASPLTRSADLDSDDDLESYMHEDDVPESDDRG